MDDFELSNFVRMTQWLSNILQIPYMILIFMQIETFCIWYPELRNKIHSVFKFERRIFSDLHTNVN